MQRSRRIVSGLTVAILGIALVASVAPGHPVRAQQAQAYFVPATWQVLAEPFLSAWVALGETRLLGQPVSGAVGGGQARTQYFERGVLTTAGDEAEVTRLSAGQALLDRPDPSSATRTGRRHVGLRETRAFRPLAGKPSSGSVTFDAKTKHAVKGAMRAAYDELGGRDALGSPLSEAFVAGGCRVQWFAMARLQACGGDVVAGSVGFELAVLDGVDMGPKRQGSLATLDLAAHARASAGPAFSPARVQIPAIGVDAAIETVGIVDGAMGVPVNPWNVGWYSGLGSPGDGGNTVMAAHKDWYGIGPVVFWSLGAVGVGNEIYLVDGAGASATYVVYETFAVDPTADAASIVGDQDGETLTLITCGGDWTGAEYNLRLIVRARRV